MKYILFMLSLILSASLFSQSRTDTTSLDYMFDDGGISTSKNIVKINLATIIIGDIPISYERVFGSAIGIEVGVGKLMSYYTPDLTELTFGNKDFTDSLEIKNLTGGNSFVLFPKFYTNSDGPLGLFFGLKYRNRKYTFDAAPDIEIVDITFNSGIQFQARDNFTLEINYGVGFRTITKEDSYSGDDTGLSIPFAIKAGYLF